MSNIVAMTFSDVVHMLASEKFSSYMSGSMNYSSSIAGKLELVELLWPNQDSWDAVDKQFNALVKEQADKFKKHNS